MDPSTQNPNDPAQPDYSNPQAPQNPSQAPVHQTQTFPAPIAERIPPAQRSNKKVIWIVVAAIVGLFLLSAIVVITLLVVMRSSHKSVTLGELINDNSSSGITSYDYDNSQIADRLDERSFRDLVPAAAEYFKYITGDNNSYRETKSISIKGSRVDIQLFNKDGQPDKNGQYGTLSPIGSSIICVSDYQNKASFMIAYDTPGSDGNTALIFLYDNTNCHRDGVMGFSREGDIIITKNKVESNIDANASNEVSEVVEGFRDAISVSPMLVNIRAHFISSFEDHFRSVESPDS